MRIKLLVEMELTPTHAVETEGELSLLIQDVVTALEAALEEQNFFAELGVDAEADAVVIRRLET